MLIVCILLISWFNSSTALEEGEDCTTNEMHGSCKLIQDCIYAQNLLKNQQNPDICGFEGLDAIVCCPVTKKSAIPTKNALLMSRPQKIQQKTLSEIKCEQFYPKPLFPIHVTGGLKSLAKEFPHMAIIGFGNETNKQWQCGGSLITKRFVLTAAHCLDSIELGPAKWVRLGDLDLSTDTDVAEPQDFSVETRIYHPDYQPPSRYNDIAILELDRDASLSVFVSPACLHVNKELKTKSLTATGWGKNSFVGNYSSYLMKVNLKHVDNSECRESYTNVSTRLLSGGIMEATQVCAGGVIGQDTCQGDSGGPLQVLNFDRSFTVEVKNLIGVTSFGKACGLSPSPGVYTRVSYYVPWIESIVWPNETWDNYEHVNTWQILRPFGTSI